MEVIEFSELRSLQEEGIEGGNWEDRTFIGIEPTGSRWLVKLNTKEEFDEVICYQLAQKFFEGIVPETHLIKLKGELGSAQRMVTGKAAHDLDDEGTLLARVRQADTMRDLANMVVMDFLIGNPDRHGNNWFIMENGRIAAIDNGLASEEMSLPFSAALRPVFRVLLADDCARTPTIIAMCRSILARVDGQEVEAESIALEYSLGKKHLFIGRWQSRVDELRRVLDIWTRELAEFCHNT